MHEGQTGTVRRTVRSSDVEASRVPSGLHAHESTLSSCPDKLTTSRPEATSHTRTVASSDAKASREPSGLHAAGTDG